MALLSQSILLCTLNRARRLLTATCHPVVFVLPALKACFQIPAAESTQVSCRHMTLVGHCAMRMWNVIHLNQFDWIVALKPPWLLAGHLNEAKSNVPFFKVERSKESDVMERGQRERTLFSEPASAWDNENLFVIISRGNIKNVRCNHSWRFEGTDRLDQWEANLWRCAPFVYPPSLDQRDFLCTLLTMSK